MSGNGSKAEAPDSISSVGFAIATTFGFNMGIEP
jgi:hypothetical protein